jgi:hypothetical protein
MWLRCDVFGQCIGETKHRRREHPEVTYGVLVRTDEGGSNDVFGAGRDIGIILLSPVNDAHLIKFQCPKCGHDLEQSIGSLRQSTHMGRVGCGVGINIDTNRLANAAEEMRCALDKVPPEITIRFFRKFHDGKPGGDTPPERRSCATSAERLRCGNQAPTFRNGSATCLSTKRIGRSPVWRILAVRHTRSPLVPRPASGNAVGRIRIASRQCSGQNGSPVFIPPSLAMRGLVEAH